MYSNCCNFTQVDMTHMLGICPRLREFWSSIFKTLNDAFQTNVQPTAEMAIFSAFVGKLLMPMNKKNAFAFVSLLALRRIVLE